MSVLLDEDAPRYLKRELPEHDISTAPESGWSAIRNGVLIGMAADAGFDVLLTCDRNIQHQQSVAALRLAVVVMAVRRKRRSIILPLVPAIRDALATEPEPGSLIVIGDWRTS